MEIIEEIEPISREYYTGCIGYLGFNEESAFSISIRTALVKDGMIDFFVGAGIVHDSDPEAEYDETLTKAEGFFQALR
jgi:anthranilate/para-aminobenzoate synthase component I